MILKAVGVTKRFGAHTALNKVSILAGPGSIHGLIGENGAGKSTLLQCLAGIVKPDEGDCRIDGLSVFDCAEAKAHLAFVPTQRHLFGSYTARQMRAFYQSVYPQFDKALYDQMVSILPISESARLGRLSTGMQMVYAISLAAATGAPFLLLDEPFAGLDVVARRKITAKLVDLCESRGTGLLVSSHNVGELEKICDTVTFLCKGEVLRTGPTDQVTAGVRRVQVVFRESAPEDLAHWPGVLSVELIGRVHYIALSGQDESAFARLADEPTALLEDLGTTLEDAFVYTSQKGGQA